MAVQPILCIILISHDACKNLEWLGSWYAVTIAYHAVPNSLVVTLYYLCLCVYTHLLCLLFILSSFPEEFKIYLNFICLYSS